MLKKCVIFVLQLNPKPKFSPKSPHSFSRISIKRVSGAFTKGQSKDEPSSVFYTPSGKKTVNSSLPIFWLNDYAQNN